jgi:hypothetical protein
MRFSPCARHECLSESGDITPKSINLRTKWRGLVRFSLWLLYPTRERSSSSHYPPKKRTWLSPKPAWTLWRRVESFVPTGSRIFSHTSSLKPIQRYSSVSAGSCITYRFGANGNRGLVSFVHSKQNIFGKTCCIVQTNYSSGVWRHSLAEGYGRFEGTSYIHHHSCELLNVPPIRSIFIRIKSPSSLP